MQPLESQCRLDRHHFRPGCPAGIAGVELAPAALESICPGLLTDRLHCMEALPLSYAFSIYALARSIGLADLGRKVDLVERSIRRGEGGDTELAEALRSQEKGDFQD